MEKQNKISLIIILIFVVFLGYIIFFSNSNKKDSVSEDVLQQKLVKEFLAGSKPEAFSSEEKARITEFLRGSETANLK